MYHSSLCNLALHMDGARLSNAAASLHLPVRAFTVDAGVDLVLCCHEPERQRRVIEALASAIDSGRIDEHRITSAHRRLDRLFARFVRA